MTKQRAVGYIRVSTDGQVDGESLPVQRQQIRSWAKAHGFTLVAIHEDAGVSGSNGVDTRQGLYDALADVTANRPGRPARASVLVVKNLDRLARKLTIQEAVLGKVWDAGARVWSIEDGGEVLEDDPDDPMRTAMRQMRGVFAQLERGMITKRMRDGRRHKADRGGYAGGAPRLGTKAVAGELVEDESERQVVGLIVEMRSLPEPVSYREICAELTRRELHTKRGGPWQPAVVRRIAEREIAGS